MSRPKSQRIELITQKLRSRLLAGVHRPGERFISARELEKNFAISYQTADRILKELCREGLLERRAASGTYLPGGIIDYQGVQLIFSSRARAEKSFGARLLHDLTTRLDHDRISWKLSWAEENVRVSQTRLPVLWEAHQALRHCEMNNQSALLMNDRPRPGLQSVLVDSVSVDDFSGGASAAQLLARNRTQPSASERAYAVLTGPAGDSRSQERRNGFLSIYPQAQVVVAGSWFFEAGYNGAEEVVSHGTDGIFCCNDRLAEAVRAWCTDQNCHCPALIGFDDAPIAEALDLTTIALPWDDLIAGAVDIIKKRLSGLGGAARQLLLTPLPVVRRF